jgi:hypothetical protein
MFELIRWTKTTTEYGGRKAKGSTEVKWDLTYSVQSEAPMAPDYDRKGQTFLPDAVDVKVANGRIDYVVIRGGLLKKDGQPGERPGKVTFYGWPNREHAPDWVHGLLADARLSTRGN